MLNHTLEEIRYQYQIPFCNVSMYYYSLIEHFFYIINNNEIHIVDLLKTFVIIKMSL